MDNFLIIGGDKRQKELEIILKSKGYECTHILSVNELHFISNETDSCNIILPVPVSKDRETVYSQYEGEKIKISDVISAVQKNSIVFGGGISNMIKTILTEKNIAYFDYLDCDEFVIYNAYLTGLGALRLLLENAESDLSRKKVLVTGFGRVARFAAQILTKVGCDVYVCARNKLQLTEAGCSGYNTIEFDKSSSYIYLFDYVFNTVPENIFNLEDVGHMKGKYFELASAPFGVRREYFRNKENSYVFGGSLPGKYFPHSAAEKLAEVTFKHINSANGGD